MSRYQTKRIDKKDLPLARIGKHDKMKADIEKQERGICEISMEGKKASNVAINMKKKLDAKKFKVFLRGDRCYVEVP